MFGRFVFYVNSMFLNKFVVGLLKWCSLIETFFKIFLRNNFNELKHLR